MKKECPCCKRDLPRESFGWWRWDHDGLCYECDPKKRNVGDVPAIVLMRKANLERSGTLCLRAGHGAKFLTWTSYENFCRANRSLNPLPFECHGCKQPQRPDNVGLIDTVTA